MDWFKINFFKANPAKFQFRVLGANKNNFFNLNAVGKVIPFSSEVKLLGTTTDYELKLKKHINKLCRKASYKLHALQRIRGYLSVDHARLFANLDEGLRMWKTIPFSRNVVFLAMDQVLKSDQISQSLTDMDVEWSERFRFCQIILFIEFFSFIWARNILLMMDKLNAVQEIPSERLSSSTGKGKISCSNIISMWLAVFFKNTEVFKGQSCKANHNLYL